MKYFQLCTFSFSLRVQYVPSEWSRSDITFYICSSTLLIWPWDQTSETPTVREIITSSKYQSIFAKNLQMLND